MGWMRFDIIAFLKDSKDWNNELERLKNELDNISELPSVDNPSGVRSGRTADLTPQTALRELKIAAEIEEIRLNKEMLKFAKKSLTEREKALLEGFFFSHRQKGVFVDEFGKKYGICRDYVYDERDKVLKKMQNIIEKEYYGED